MKITKQLAQKLVSESPSFRQFIVDEMFKVEINNLIGYVKNICTIQYPFHKIAAIKAIRELSRETVEGNFYDAFGFKYNDQKILTLQDAKHIVELYQD